MKTSIPAVILICLSFVSLAQTNTFFGTNAGNGTIGNLNSSFGFAAGDVSASAGGTFIGHQAGKSVASGYANSFVGAFSGVNTTKGNNNAFFGYASGAANIDGSSNSYYGSLSGMNNVSGINNSYFGSSSGFSTNGGHDNAAFGFEAGKNNTTGFWNAFVGSGAGKGNIDGFLNAYFGYQAGAESTNGIHNTFVGAFTGTLTQSWDNTFIGAYAGGNNTTGSVNVFIGASSGGFNATGTGNVMLGTFTGSQNISGNYNTYLGHDAGAQNQGSNNIFIGTLAGHDNTNVNSKFILSTNSNGTPLLFGDFLTSQIGVGTTTLGTYALSVNGDAFATGMWTSSDRRFKEKEQPISSALIRVQQVKGVNYEFKGIAGKNFAKGQQVGFIAQDLQKAFPELVRADEEGYLAVNYQGMIPVLVEAIKELSHQVTELKSRAAESSGLPTFNIKDGARLDQNHPNPFDKSTRITYTLPEGSAASLYVFDLTGRQVATFPNLKQGSGEVVISASQLSPGLYHYALIVDGAIVDTKKMLLTQ